jgi:hypothetical protein
MPRKTDVIILTQKNFLDSNSNVLRYSFAQPVLFKNARINLVSLTLYNSFYNISASRFGNNQFSVTWIDGHVYEFSIRDGNYSYDQLSAYIAFVLEGAGLYMVDSNGKNVYAITLAENSTAYACQLNVLYVPNAAGAATLGYTIPTNPNWNAWPTNPTTPQITFSFGLSKIVGFQSTTYGESRTLPPTPQADNYFYISPSSTAPTISPVYTLYVECNLLNGTYGGSYPHIMTTCPIDARYGGLIRYTSSYDRSLAIFDGKYSHIDIRLLDNNFDSMAGLIIDKEVTVILDIQTDE